MLTMPKSSKPVPVTAATAQSSVPADYMQWLIKVVEQLSHDLKSAYPDMKGLSLRNLRYMRAFAEAWPDREMLQQAAATLPRGHVMVLLDRLSTPQEREWHARGAVEHGWSRNVLVHQSTVASSRAAVPP